MSVFDRWFGNGDRVRSARRAELRGDLSRAAELWGLAGRPEESARVMLLRGDAELDAQLRMQHYIQALGVAPKGHPVEREARLRRALFTVTLAAQQGPAGAISAALRRDLQDAAADLLALGEASRAADAYRLARDEEGEARALTQAGEVEKLETLLSSEQDRDRHAREKRKTAQEVEILCSSGRRREAIATAQDRLAVDPDDRHLRDRVDAISQRRLKGPIIHVTLNDKAAILVLGDEVVIGRSEGDILVHSHAVSRRHLRLARNGDRIMAHDLGSKNGTTLRGMRVSGSVQVDEGIELKLGNEVPLHLSPSDELPGFTAIEIVGRRFLAPFGPAPLHLGDWTLVRSSDGWIELRAESPPAFLGDAHWTPRSTLLSGDAIGKERSGHPVLLVSNGE